MNKKIITLLCVLALLVGLCAVVVAADAASAVAAIGTQYFDTLEAAVAAVDAANPGDAVITLRKDVTSATVDKTVYLNLAGKNIGTVDVTEGVTLYCLDSETDDYAIDGDATNGFSGYGLIAAVTGEGKVAGVEAGMIPVPASEEYVNGSLDGYLMVEEEGKGLSFHRANLQIKSMVLRAKEEGATEVNPSVYYKSAFAGDALVAENVKTFGIALSVQEEPNANNMGISNAYSWFEGADFNAGENNSDATSTLLQGVMKESNANLRNKMNANMPIYGKAYIQTKDNAFIFGACADWSLKQQAEAADGYFDEYAADKQAALMEMYDIYRAVMQNWSVENIADAPRDYVSILGIGNSYTIDSMHILNEVYKAEGNDKKLTLGIAYYGGCTLAQHSKFINENSAVYSYLYLNEQGTWTTEKNVTLRYILQQQNWDLVSMQQGSASSGRIDTYDDNYISTIRDFVERILGYAPTYMWNMTWAWPVEDVEGDAFTTATSNSTFTTHYGGSQETMYRMIVDCVKEKIVTDPKFEYLMPVGTAIHNARGTFLGDPDLHRDGSHVSDLGRLIASYVWYCEIEGVTLDTIQLSVVPDALTVSYKGDMAISEEVAQAIAESVKSAMENKFESTNIMQESDPEEDEDLNILMIGNSFCYYYVEELYGMLEAAGYENVNICNVYYSGCPLSSHWTWWKNGKSNYTSFYSTSKAGRVLIGENVSLDTCLEYANWDIISLQEAGARANDSGADHLALTESYLDDLWAHIKKQYPMSRYLWQHTWSRQIGYNRNGETMETPEQQTLHNNNTRAFAVAVCNQYDLEHVPSGDAWQIVRNGGYDNLCARLSSNDGVGDYYHDGDIGGGQYLNACVWFEAITGESCVGNTYIPAYATSKDITALLDGLNVEATEDGYRLTDAFILDLQNAAHSAIQQRNAE